MRKGSHSSVTILGAKHGKCRVCLAVSHTLRELFRFWPQKDEEARPKWTERLFYAVAAVLVTLLLKHHAPDEAARARYQKRMSNIIDDICA
ncbi:hypothetical protein V6N11_026552 [Hibiscus sabdariffa]|uniref:Uncharacterized protein n=1 Tax=Hibiscus sabdariffa TaxID=183260 RepID=A0ABR2SWK9_9ROSI